MPTFSRWASRQDSFSSRTTRFRSPSPGRKSSRSTRRPRRPRPSSTRSSSRATRSTRSRMWLGSSWTTPLTPLLTFTWSATKSPASPTRHSRSGTQTTRLSYEISSSTTTRSCSPFRPPLPSSSSSTLRVRCSRAPAQHCWQHCHRPGHGHRRASVLGARQSCRGQNRQPARPSLPICHPRHLPMNFISNFTQTAQHSPGFARRPS